MIIFGIILFTILSAIFSGTEIAFVSANKVGIEIEKNKNSLRAKILSSYYNKPNEFISVLLIGNNIALVILTFLFSKFLDPYVGKLISNSLILLLVNTIIITVFILIFAEFIPKTIFRAYANETITALVFPIYFFHILLKIPTIIFTNISTFLLKYIFKTKIADNDIQLTRIDLENFVDNNISEDDDIEKEMFQNVLNLNQVKVKEVMVPRPEIITIDKTATREELIKTFNKSKHSRIIVIDDTIENVLGYIHHQQLIMENFKIVGEAIMPITFIAETMNVRDLMLRFIKDSQNLTIIVDEYGSVSGLVTLEDLIEEIFGEIQDEYDREDAIEKDLGNNEYIFSGRLEIDYINENYGLHLDDEEYNTLSGLIVMTFGSIPKNGDEFELGDYIFKILKVGKKKVDLVKIIRLNHEDRDSNEE